MCGPGEQSLSGHFKVDSKDPVTELTQMHIDWRKEYLNERIAPESGCGWLIRPQDAVHISALKTVPFYLASIIANMEMT